MNGRLCLAMVGVAAFCASSALAWDMSQETYSCTTSGMTLQELAQGGVTVISHTPPNPEYCAEAHRWGLKVLPYVSLYKVSDTTRDPSLLTAPFWRHVDASKHPEWFLLRPDGEIRKPFNDPDYPVGYLQSCCNHESLMRAYEAGVRDVLQQGADGVFVDNVHPYPVCHGPELGKHTHDWPEKDNTACYKEALRRVYRVVKSYGADRVVILNSGHPSREYVGYGDSLMWESYVWRFAFADDVGPAVTARRWLSWDGVISGYEAWKKLTDRGLSIAPYTYLPDSVSAPENAFFAYGCARLAGFSHWTGSGTDRRDILRRLYRVRLGRATGSLVQEADVAYRMYQRGLVVVNPQKQSAVAQVPAPDLDVDLAELFSGRQVFPRNGKLRLKMPAESARIILSKRDVLTNFVQEVQCEALAANLRLGELANKQGAHQGVPAVRRGLRATERSAAEVAVQLACGVGQTRRLQDLTLRLPTNADLGATDSAEALLIARARELRVEQVTELVKQVGAASPQCRVDDDGIVLSSAGATHTIKPRGRALVDLGGHRLELWISPGPGQERHRWLHARPLSEVQVLQDTLEEKRVSARFECYGNRTNETVPGTHGELTAWVRRDSPALHLDVKIVNDGTPRKVYAFLAAGVRWQTDPTLGTVAAHRSPDHRGVRWCYLHRGPQGGGGLLLTRVPAIGQSGGSYIFGNPRDQQVATGESFDLSFTAAPVIPSPGDDGFLRERLDNLRRYAGLAAGLSAGMGLRTELSALPARGAKVQVDMGLTGPGRGRVRAVEFRLGATVAGEALAPRLTPGPSAHRALAWLQVPGSTTVGATLELRPRALVSLPDGSQVLLEGLERFRVPETVSVISRTQAHTDLLGQIAGRLALRSHIDRDLPVGLTLTAPAGWQVQDARQTLTVPGRGQASARFLLTSPGASVNALANCSLALTVAEQPSQTLPWGFSIAPRTQVPPTPRPPVIDGKLDDPAWRNAATLTDFVSHQDAKPVTQPTVAMVTYDARAVYIALRCSEEHMDQLREKAIPDGTRTSPDVPQDDSIEVYVRPSPGGDSFSRFAVNCAGVRKSGARGPWDSAALQGSDAWTVELAIPYTTLDVTSPVKGAIWGLNVCRNQPRLGEYSCWSCTYGAYAQPSRFGWATFR